MDNANVTLEDLHELLDRFGKSAYMCQGIAPEGSLDHKIMAKVEALFKLDYSIAILENGKHSMCLRYPERILIPESEQMSNTLTSNKNTKETETKRKEETSPEIIKRFLCQPLTGDSPPLEEVSATSTDFPQQLSAFSEPLNSYTLVYLPLTNSRQQQTLTRPQQQQKSTPQPQKSSPQQRISTTQQQSQQQQTIYESSFDIAKVRELIPMARYARCRNRFVVPVILFRGKFICRSSTIAIPFDQYVRKTCDMVSAFTSLGGEANPNTNNINGNNLPNGININFNSTNGNNSNRNRTNGNRTNGYITNGNSNNANRNGFNDCEVVDLEMDDPAADEHAAVTENYASMPYFSHEEIIKSDVELLKALNVKTIVDLMVENCKVKYLISVSSSEKADEQQRYKDFEILGIPYPGCEFFKKFRNNNYEAENLYFDWDRKFIDVEISIPQIGHASGLDIEWSEYKSWDLAAITQNYLKAILKYIQDDGNGILVHCISGWDRTPLFISLIRISLWADGHIHKSLGPLEMAYLTLAYDWYLFGHQLPNRLNHYEDILIFCFHILKYIWSEDFSVDVSIPHRRRTKTTSSCSSFAVLDEDLFEELGEETPSPESFPDYFICSEVFEKMPTITQLSKSSLASPSSPTKIQTTARSTNPKRNYTNPIAVPGSSSRQRHDSGPLGSWQYVNNAGSIDSKKDIDVPKMEAESPPSTARRLRLESLRNIVLPAYAQMVGLAFNEGTGIIGNITEMFF